MRFSICLILTLLLAGCQSPKQSSPFELTGFWSSDKVRDKKVIDQGESEVAGLIPLKGKIFIEEDYRLGPGDQVQIVVRNQKDISGGYTVMDDGTIRFPLIESIQVRGLTRPELKKELEEALSKYFRQPLVQVEVTAKQIIVYGAIGDLSKDKLMGVYTLEKSTRLLPFLASVGGPRADADLKNISILHQDGTKEYVDLNRVIFQGDMRQNLMLRPGDLLYVPSFDEGTNKFLVYGAVKVPKIYSFRSNITALEAISLAGSFEKEAKPEETIVIRTNVEKPYLIKVNLKRVLTKGETQRDIPLIRGDIVYVPSNSFANYNRFIKNVTPTLRLLEDLTEVIIDIDTIIGLFERGFGKNPIDLAVETQEATARKLNELEEEEEEEELAAAAEEEAAAAAAE